MISIGQVVYSKCGRDKGKAFIVHSFDENYVYIVDGKLRTLQNPKKKKYKHIQVTGNIVYNIKDKLENKLYILDAEFRKALDVYKQ